MVMQSSLNAEEQLEARLLERLDSPAIEMVAADWNAIRREALAAFYDRERLP